jgi:hypothetical protein
MPPTDAALAEALAIRARLAQAVQTARRYSTPALIQQSVRRFREQTRICAAITAERALVAARLEEIYP